MEHQRGSPAWDENEAIANENRTDALDLSRDVIRRRAVVLPRQLPIVEEFAKHMAADAKRLEEDPDTGAKSYRYIRTGEDHFSLAFTYDCLAAIRLRGAGPGVGASTPEQPLFRGWIGAMPERRRLYEGPSGGRRRVQLS